MHARALPSVTVLAQSEALACLAASGGEGSPFQNALWLECWLEAQGELADFRLVDIESAGGHMLLPLRLAIKSGIKLALKVGGGHASFFTPVRVGSPEALTKSALKAAAHALGVDALVLTDCPGAWANEPLYAATFPAAPDIARGVTLANIERLYGGEAGKKLRAKGRKLAAAGVVTHGFLTGEEAEAALRAMLGWKSAQFAARGIVDPFAEPGVQRFIAAGLARGALRLFALKRDGRPLAALVMAQSARHASGMAIAHDPAEDIARFGPGDVLLSQLVETLASSEMTGFDLGVGEARYKRLHCPEVMALMDVYAAATLKGAVYVAAHALVRRAKGHIKRNEGVFSALTGLRATLRTRASGS